ncbi:replication-relaxation family protein [Brevibacillus centrosporus]|uniref:replication-relaxation family protein n=1 Tax=Brevibacillus centrosporus TaxID=54910 RepID=UPI002E2153B8|nr:replication-relaxation family protein [Brevibacillus centrosporus]
MSRSQIQRLHRLGGDRNAQIVLKQMEEYLHCFREGRYGTVYYLSKMGRDMIGAKKQVKRTLQTKHTLMRNDFFFYIGCPSNWSNETKVTIDEKVMVISDAVFVKDKKYHFLEVDNTQTMTENRLKIEKYREIYKTGQFQRQYQYFPTLHVVTVNRSRMKRFTDMCDGLPVQVYLIDDIK